MTRRSCSSPSPTPPSCSACRTGCSRRSCPSSSYKLRRLKRTELPVDTATLANYLVGKTLVRDAREGRTAGRIVEAEAYVRGDAAGHAYVGETARNRSLFLRRGHAYVYFIYGMHWCFNVSAETAKVGAGVLVRALEPLDGIELMIERRRSEARRVGKSAE